MESFSGLVFRTPGYRPIMQSFADLKLVSDMHGSTSYFPYDHTSHNIPLFEIICILLPRHPRPSSYEAGTGAALPSRLSFG